MGDETPKRLTYFCRECEWRGVLSQVLELHADSTFDLPVGLHADAIRWVEGDRVEVVGLCTTCREGNKLHSQGPKADKWRAEQLLFRQKIERLSGLSSAADGIIEQEEGRGRGSGEDVGSAEVERTPD